LPIITVEIASGIKMTYAGFRGDEFQIYSDTTMSEIHAILAQFKNLNLYAMYRD
jgi:hypothetical protein